MMNQVIRFSVHVAALVGVAFGLAGCNTMQGLGRDISSGGRALSRGATDVQHNIENKQHHSVAPAGQSEDEHRAI